MSGRDAGTPLDDPLLRLEKVFVCDFNLEATLHSGQAFGWHRIHGGHVGVIGQVPVFLRQPPGQHFLEVTRGRKKLASRYLALDHDLAGIVATFPRDARMTAALDFCGGMRILRQPLWECLASFIASAQKQVAHIRQIHRRLCERHGRRVGACGEIALYEFPGASVLAGLDEAALKECGLGFRAKNLLAVARAVASGAFHLDKLRSIPTPAARERLMQLPGVGAKIANCVLLFALERLDAVPVDVWVARIMRESYVRKKKMTLPQLESLARRRFGPFAGYAQQILFHHARNRSRLVSELKRSQNAG